MIIGNKVVTAAVSATDVNNFNITIDQLFKDIAANITAPRAFQPVELRVKKALKENVFGYKNNPGYKEVKEVLKAEGLIEESGVLQVSGQLIEDYGYSLLNVSPDQILGGFGFSKTLRERPTLGSMKHAVRKPGTPLTYKSMRSSDVVRALENATAFVDGSSTHKRAKFPISDNIFDKYRKDIESRVIALIDRAFAKHSARAK